jgi:2,3,4,5-tetrahydropyridine-2-carboxylate N-succinyltransferase
MKWRETIEQAFANRDLLASADTQEAVRAVIEEVDKGRLRVAEPTELRDGW